MKIITVRHHPLCVYLLCTLHHLVRLGLQAFYLHTYIHILQVIKYWRWEWLRLEELPSCLRPSVNKATLRDISSMVEDRVCGQ